jgi:hypothetical protein
MAIKDVISGFFLNVKNDKGLLVRVIVGLVLFLVTFILGFAFIVRMWVHQGYHTKFALEEVGHRDPDFTETFPQVYYFS